MTTWNSTAGRAGKALLTGIALSLAATAYAQAAGELNLYSSRHYETDERLYSDFTEATGIKVNRIEDSAGALMARIKAEGTDSPADILLTVDAGNLWKADQDGLFQPIESQALNERIPAQYRHPDGHWFGFSTRGRVIFYDKASVSNPPQTYEALADPQYKGMVCARSSSNIYMQSLLASIVERVGEEKAQEWAAGLKANLARNPQGGDTDQLRGIVSGECRIAISNTYYFARAIRRDVRDLTGSTDKLGIVFPNQGGAGTHVNISGGGVVANAPNRENAIKFLEYLASDAAQAYFAAGNDEYPVVDGASLSSSVQSLGEFEASDMPLTALGTNQATAQKIYAAVGYE